MLKEGSNRACTDPPQDGAAWFPCCEVSAPTWQFRASTTRYCSPGLRPRLPEVLSARARPEVGGAKGLCPLSPVPDWLALPQRGHVFRSTQCFGEERGSPSAAGRVGGARSQEVFRREFRRLPLVEPPPVVPRERAGWQRREEEFPRRVAACEVPTAR